MRGQHRLQPGERRAIGDQVSKRWFSSPQVHSSTAVQIAILSGKWRNSAPCDTPMADAICPVVNTAGSWLAANSMTVATASARRSSAER
jgi:hypothetical protein